MEGGSEGDIKCIKYERSMCSSIVTIKIENLIHMFNFLKKDPASKLQKKYEALLEKAMQAQRSGDIKLYARLTAQSEEVWKDIEQLKAQ